MEATAKQSIVERIKGATNILVTVSRDPSVDELSAALGLTLMLNKMDKHATAVVSGKVPSALEFLEPNKTFESTVNSLRDFIIALDKEKADRLRYKVEDDVVRIFITPYRTTISEKDLNFSQGDFNVELVIALGVEKKEDLDTAIAAHGRILHDATVVSINADGGKSSLGSIDWSDSNVSSLCEMLMSLSEALQSGLLDEQIASALLTGLVAATERFSNTHTSPRVMTMAAQLMAAGANQQLIAAKLEEGHQLPTVSQVAPDGSQQLTEDSSQKLTDTPKVDDAKPKKADGEMTIEHEPTAEPVPAPLETPAEKELSTHIAAPTAPTLSVDDLRKDLDEAAKDLHEAAATTETNPTQETTVKPDWRNREIEPTFGGTLSATADDAEEEKRREELSSQNHKILTHDAPAAAGQGFTVPAYAQDEPPSVDPFAEPPKADPDAPLHYEPTPIKTIAPLQTPEVPPAVPTQSAPTLAELESEVRNPSTPEATAAASLDDARAAVDAALSSLSTPSPSVPLQASTPVETATAPPIEMPPVIPEQSAPQDAPSLPPLPPLPDFSTLPPLPSDPATTQPPADFSEQTPPHLDAPLESPLPPTAPDPGQFKIPGQQ